MISRQKCNLPSVVVFKKKKSRLFLSIPGQLRFCGYFSIIAISQAWFFHIRTGKYIFIGNVALFIKFNLIIPAFIAFPGVIAVCNKTQF
jgi:hypothetical protein